MKIAAIWYPVDGWQAAKSFYGEVVGLPQVECDDGIGRVAYATDGRPPLILVQHPMRAGCAIMTLACPDVAAL